MKILLANLHFWPDTPPHAVILKSIAESLAKDNDVIVVASQPCYKKNYKVALEPKVVVMDEGYSVHRINLGLENTGRIYNKLKVFFGYAAYLFLKIIKEKPDRTIMGTNPPILGMFAVRLASRITGGDYIYHCQDMHPEIAGTSGALSKGVVYKRLLGIERKNCENSFLTIVLSEDMRTSLIERGCSANKIKIVNNFDLRDETSVDSSHSIQTPTELLRGKGKFRLIFAGNVGRFQGLESVIESAKLLSKDYPEIEFVFLGDGAAVKVLEKLSGNMLNKTVYFFPHQPVAIARELIADAQLGIVSLSKEIYKYAFPSKTMTYLCEGVPLLSIIETDSSLTKLVMDHEIGITSTSEDVENIASQVVGLYEDKNRLLKMKINAKKYATENYSVETVLPKLTSVFCEKA